MSNNLEHFLVQKASGKGTPIKATLELTPLCNLNCEMCYIRHSMEEVKIQGGLKPVSYWKNLIPEMKKMGILFVALIGGEPFTYPDLQSLYESLLKNGFYVNLTTNATILSNGVPQWLKTAPPRYVTVSLYGASDETYAAVTGNPNGFSQTIAGLENLLREKIPVKLNYIVIPKNKHDLEAVFELKKHYQLPIIASSYCFPRVRTMQIRPLDRLSAQQCAREDLRIRQLNDPEQYNALLRYLASGQFQQSTAKHTTKMYCHAGSSTFWITWQGNMVPCGMMKNISIDTTYRSLEESWQILKNKVSHIRICSECACCDKREICQVCPAIMEAETGHVNGCPDYLCRMIEEEIQFCKDALPYS